MFDRSGWFKALQERAKQPYPEELKHSTAQQLNEEADSERGQHAIGPNHLRSGIRAPVLSGLEPWPLFGQETEAPEAGSARRGKDRLAADGIAAGGFMHVHPDVEIGDQEAPGEPLELGSLAEGIDSAEDDVAPSQDLQAFLPPRAARHHLRVGNKRTTAGASRAAKMGG